MPRPGPQSEACQVLGVPELRRSPASALLACVSVSAANRDTRLLPQRISQTCSQASTGVREVRRPAVPYERAFVFFSRCRTHGFDVGDTGDYRPAPAVTLVCPERGPSTFSRARARSGLGPRSQCQARQGKRSRAASWWGHVHQAPSGYLCVPSSQGHPRGSTGLRKRPGGVGRSRKERGSPGLVGPGFLGT